jgi:type III restriction enzyme
MIKIGTIFNENLINIKIDEDKDMMDTILELAIKKRNELELLYRAEGSNVIPLCLIQLPNKTVDPNMKDNVLKFLSKYNDNGSNFKENEDFTIWLSEQKDNKTIETINENGIKFLIFKQAMYALAVEIQTVIGKEKLAFIGRQRASTVNSDIAFKQAVAIGWDCPRAHILVKFRPIKKELEAFDLQTIGRVLRTPEHKHYKKQDLNYAYIYAEDKKIEFDNEVKEAFDGASPIYENQKIKDEFIPIIQHAEQFLITQIYEEKNPEDKLIRNKLIDNLKEFCQHKSKSLDYTKISVESFSIDSNDLDQIELLDSNLHNQKEIKSSRKIIKNQYLKFIYELSKFDLIKEKDFKIILKQHLINNLNEVILGTTDEDIEFSFVELVLSYKISILQAFQETNKEKNISIIRTVKEFKPFEFDKSPKFQSKNPNFGIKNIYVPGVDSGYSEPEKTFINLLDQNDNVIAWYKNKDKGSHALCVNYQTSHQNKGKTILQDNPTYPDFVVFFKNLDIGIYEIKDLDKQEIVNKDKSLGIVSFLKKLNSENTSIKFHGGLIYINQTTNTIDNSKDFSEL